MSLEIHSIAIPSYTGITIQQLLLSQPDAKRLVVLLPGLGYFVDAPLLYYLREIALQHGDAVLSVKYGFQAAQQDYEAEQQTAITQETKAAIETALAHGNYASLFLVGKSLGTPLAALFANHFTQTQKAILLTPIQNAHKLIQRTDTLAIIGTGDSRYSADLVQDTALIKWQVYEGLNHSLELPNDYQASLRVLSEIMLACETFLYA